MSTITFEGNVILFILFYFMKKWSNVIGGPIGLSIEKKSKSYLCNDFVLVI